VDENAAMGTIPNDITDNAGNRLSHNFQQIKKKTTINDVDDEEDDYVDRGLVKKHTNEIP
jgi:hypothetical protein